MWILVLFKPVFFFLSKFLFLTLTEWRGSIKARKNFCVQECRIEFQYFVLKANAWLAIRYLYFINTRANIVKSQTTPDRIPWKDLPSINANQRSSSSSYLTWNILHKRLYNKPFTHTTTREQKFLSFYKVKYKNDQGGRMQLLDPSHGLFAPLLKRTLTLWCAVIKCHLTY